MRFSTPIRLFAAMAVAGLSISACGDSSSSTSPAAGGGGAATGKPVDIKNFAFSPADLTIPVGSAVTWTNQDPSIHTTTSLSGPASFDSGNLDQGKTFSFTFAKAGKYAYKCSIHSNMMGSVTAQ